MPRITDEQRRVQYSLVEESHRAHPGEHKRASEHAGCAVSTARRYYHDGVPGLDLPPIARVLDGDRAVARAALARAGEGAGQLTEDLQAAARGVLAVADGARLDTIAQVINEATVIREGKALVLSNLRQLRALVEGMEAATARAVRELAEEPDDVGGVAAKLLQLAVGAERLANAVIKLMQAERLLLREPITREKHEITGAEEALEHMTSQIGKLHEEARRVLEHGAADPATRRALLKVVEGGGA